MPNVCPHVKGRIHCNGIKRAQIFRRAGKEIALHKPNAGPVLPVKFSGTSCGQLDRNRCDWSERGQGVQYSAKTGGRLKDATAHSIAKGGDQLRSECRRRLEQLESGHRTRGGAVLLACRECGKPGRNLLLAILGLIVLHAEDVQTRTRRIFGVRGPDFVRCSVDTVTAFAATYRAIAVPV